MRDIEHYLLIKAKGENKIRSTCTKENSERGKHDPDIFITVKVYIHQVLSTLSKC